MGLKSLWSALLSALGGGGQAVTVQQLKNAQEQGAYILDVRTPGEYAGGHVAGSHLLPLNDLAAQLEKVPAEGDIYVMCQSGGRSAMACRILRQAGRSAVNVRGGVSSWKAAGFPLER